MIFLILLKETVEGDIQEIYEHINLKYVQKYCKDCEAQWKQHKRWYRFLIHSNAYVLYTLRSSRDRKSVV